MRAPPGAPGQPRSLVPLVDWKPAFSNVRREPRLSGAAPATTRCDAGLVEGPVGDQAGGTGGERTTSPFARDAVADHRLTGRRLVEQADITGERPGLRVADRERDPGADEPEVADRRASVSRPRQRRVAAADARRDHFRQAGHREEIFRVVGAERPHRDNAVGQRAAGHVRERARCRRTRVRGQPRPDGEIAPRAVAGLRRPLARTPSCWKPAASATRWLASLARSVVSSRRPKPCANAQSASVRVALWRRLAAGPTGRPSNRRRPRDRRVVARRDRPSRAAGPSPGQRWRSGGRRRSPRPPEPVAAPIEPLPHAV